MELPLSTKEAEENRSGGDTPDAPAAPAPERPKSWLTEAVLLSVCFCVPFDIVALFYAAKVESFYLTGAYAQAAACSRKARKWVLWGVAAIAACAVVLGLLLLEGSLAESSPAPGLETV